MKTQIKKLFKASLIYGIGNVLIKSLNILLLPLFTTFLSPKDFGIISILTLYSVALENVFSLGTNAGLGISYFNKKTLISRRQVIFNCFIFLLLSSGIMFVLNLLFNKSISQLLFQSNIYINLIFLTVITTVFSMSANPFMLQLQFEEKQTTYIIFSGTYTLLTLVLSILYVAVLKEGIWGLVVARLISTIFIFILYFLRSFINKIYKYSWKVIKELIKISAPLTLSFFFLMVLSQGNIYYLKQFHALETVGLYSVGYSIGIGISLLISAISTAWTPFFLSFINKKQEAEILFNRIFTYFIWITGSISICFYLFAKPVVYLLTKPAFFESYRIVGLTTTSIILGVGIWGQLLPALYYAKKTKFVSLFQAIAVIIYIIVGFFLIKYFGIIGAGYSSIIGYLSMDIVLYLWNKKKGKKYLNITYDWHRNLVFVLFYIFITSFLVFFKAEKLMSVILIIISILSINIFIIYYSLYENERKFIKIILNNLKNK